MPGGISKGMWVSVSGAAAQSQNMDASANNLANSSVDTFKKTIPTFKEHLASLEKSHEGVDIPRGLIKDKDFYPIDGRDQSFVLIDGTSTVHQQGAIRGTDNILDIALDGKGFIEVNTPQGVRYSRGGSLKTNEDGILMTFDGHPVLGKPMASLATDARLASPANSPSSNLPPSARSINLKDRGSQLSITSEGEIYDQDDLVGKISIVEFKDLGKLKKQGNQLFENTAFENLLASNQTQVIQSSIEGSNVNPIEEMTRIISTNRLFEQNMKAIKTYSELMGIEATGVGKI